MEQPSPLDALRSGDLGRAWELADLHDAQPCLLWHLLLMWELKDAGRLGEARATLLRLRQNVLPRVERKQKRLDAFVNSIFGEKAGPVTVSLDEWVSRYAVLIMPIVLEVCEETFISLRRLLDDEALSALRQRLAECSRLPMTREMVQETKTDTATVLSGMWKTDEDDMRAEALKEIAVSQAQRGDFVAALPTAQMIPEDDEQAQALRDIAAAQAQAGDRETARSTFAAAVEAAQKIERAQWQETMLQRIAEEQFKVGEREAAQATFRIAVESAKAREGEDAAQTLIQVATKQRRIGDERAARATLTIAVEAAKHIQDNVHRAMRLGDIAKGLAQMGDFTAALALCEGELMLSALATVQVIMEEFDTALETARKERWPENTLREIASGQARARQHEAARATIQQMKYEWSKAQTLATIAQEQAKAGEFASALETAQEIRDGKIRVAALTEIALRQFQAEEKDAAQATFDVAIQIAQELEGEEQSDALRNIAERQTQIGQFSAAIETVKKIVSQRTQVMSMCDIAEAQAQAKQSAAAQATFAAAVEVTRSIEDKYSRSEKLMWIAERLIKAQFREQAVQTITPVLTENGDTPLRVATILAEAGNREHFKQLLIPCASSLDSAYRMCGLLARLYPEQAAVVAKVVMGNEE